jgi:hypothetical protein
MTMEYQTANLDMIQKDFVGFKSLQENGKVNAKIKKNKNIQNIPYLLLLATAPYKKARNIINIKEK